jgi:uncharacterized SAM-binding protein YcdF (DUF218 family)
MAVFHAKKRRLRGWRVLLLIGIIWAVYLVTLIVRIHLAGQHDEKAPADVIIILGAAQANGVPRPVLKERLNHGIALYRQGYARYLLFTGGNRPGDRGTEASAGRYYALARGVPAEAILVEPSGHTTMQSLQACAEIMRAHVLKRAILVSDPFHTFRLRRMANDIGMDAVASPTPSSAVQGSWMQLHYELREVGVYSLYRLCGI